MGLFSSYYSTLLGRNVYNQNRRQYVYTPYTNGVYYSDCSSSLCATFIKMGINIGLYNTAGMYRNGEQVDVKIENGHIVDGFENLREGDCLLFRGYPYENNDRHLGIGHVEGIYELGKDEASTKICGHGSGNPSLKVMSTYLKQRESSMLSNGKTKGLVSVVRFIKDKGNTLDKGEVVYPTEYINNGVVSPVKTNGLKSCMDGLLVRDVPDYSVRPRWFKIDKGYVSAYKLEGWVKDSYGWWYLREDFQNPKFCADTINGMEYHFDKNGYMLLPDRLSGSGNVIY